jgi:HEAT repeat protein
MTSDKNYIFDQKSLNDADPEVVIKAIQGLNSVEPETAYQAIDTLIDLLDHPNNRVRLQAAQTLGRMELAEPRIIEALLEATYDKDKVVKRSAIGSLGNLIHGDKNPDPDVIERLLQLTFDADERVREKTAFALGYLELRHTAIITRLVALLKDRDLTVRGNAIDALGKIGNRTHLPLIKKFITPEPVYDIYDSNLVTKAKNAFEQISSRDTY